MKRLVVFALPVIILSSCGENKTETTEAENKTTDSAFGKIEIYDPAANALIDSNAVVEMIAKGFTWSE